MQLHTYSTYEHVAQPMPPLHTHTQLVCARIRPRDHLLKRSHTECDAKPAASAKACCLKVAGAHIEHPCFALCQATLRQSPSGLSLPGNTYSAFRSIMVSEREEEEDGKEGESVRGWMKGVKEQRWQRSRQRVHVETDTLE